MLKRIMQTQVLNGLFGNNFHGHIFSQNKIDGVSWKHACPTNSRAIEFLSHIFVLL